MIHHFLPEMAPRNGTLAAAKRRGERAQKKTPPAGSAGGVLLFSSERVCYLRCSGGTLPASVIIMPGVIATDLAIAWAMAWVWVRITSGIILRAGKRIGQAPRKKWIGEIRSG